MKPNVLLVVLDSVRAKNTSLHGHDNETTPFFEELSSEATVYEQARSPGVESLSSHTSIFTGYHVPQHRTTSADCSVDAGELVWTQLRERHGYQTGVFTENPFLTKGTLAQDRAYDTVVDWREKYPYPDAIDPKAFLADGEPRYLGFLRACLDHHPVRSMANGVILQLQSRLPDKLPDTVSPKVSAGTYTDAFLDWEDEQEGPWAACINMMDAHTPYSPTDECNRWDDGSVLQLQSEINNITWEFSCGHRPLNQLKKLERLYDGAIASIDQQLRRLKETLSERGVLENTLLVITSDHGEAFGETSRIRPDTSVVAHGASAIHDVVTHVPLVVKHPGQSSGRQVRDPATLTRFPDVVMETISGDSAPSFVPDDGTVVSHAAGEKTPKIHDKIQNYCDDLWPYTGTGRAVYRSGTDGVTVKYCSWREREATVAVPDAQHQTILDDEAREVIEKVYDGMEEVDISSDRDADITSSTREHLSDLGYT